MSNVSACYQLLELNVISAQDLAPVGRSMRTYAIAWTDPDRKLSTRVDSQGGTNPSWNDKFVFRVDEDFLYDENSMITIDIYALHWFRDIHVGTAHVLAEDIIPPSRPSHGNNKPAGMRFVGLQVRRPSGRPKGILNVGVAAIDSSTRSMPLYTHDNTPVVEYHHNDINLHNQPRHQPNPELRRSKSDTSSMIGSELAAHEKRLKVKRERANSQVIPSEVSTNSKKESSLSGAHLMAMRTPKRGKFGRTNINHTNEEFNATANVSYDYKVKASPKPQFRNSPAAANFSYDYEVKASPKPQFRNSPAAANVSYDYEVKASPKPQFLNSPAAGNFSYDYEVKASPKPQFRNSPAAANVSYDYEVKASPKPQFRNSPAAGNFSYDYEVKASPKPQFRNSPAAANVSYDYEVKASPKPQFRNSPAANVSYDYEVKASPKPQFRNSPTTTRAYNDGSVRATPLHGGVRATPLHGGVRATPLHAFAVTNAAANASIEYRTPYRSNMGHRRPIIIDSELGPSASEVAAALARQPVVEEGENSTVTGWSLDESVEGLQPKIERWRTDLAPVYDNGEKSTSSGKKKGNHSRRRTDGGGGGGGNGLFSCFSVICGVECSIVCGGKKKKNQLRRTQSVDNTSFI